MSETVNFIKMYSVLFGYCYKIAVYVLSHSTASFLWPDTDKENVMHLIEGITNKILVIFTSIQI